VALKVEMGYVEARDVRSCWGLGGRGDGRAAVQGTGD
jgi:hypothetical protein